MNVLVVAEYLDGAFKKSTYELLGKASSFGGDVSAVVVGVKGTSSVEASEKLGAYGVKTVYVPSGDDFKSYSSTCQTRAVQEAISDSNSTVVLASGSSIGKDILPRLSARLKVGLASDVTDIVVNGEDVTGHRSQYAGKVFCDVTIKSAIKLFTVRPDSFPQPAAGKGAAEIKAMDIDISDSDRLNKVVSIEAFASEVVDLTEAERIVSGGRSVKSKENFDTLIRPLASALGATPGASRAAVDDGFAAHSDQVGQTGKVVNPTLYIACGISGAIQHLAGMRTSRVIVAINKDKEAPIFKHATYGIVADMFEICPELTKALSDGTSVVAAPKPVKTEAKPVAQKASSAEQDKAPSKVSPPAATKKSEQGVEAVKKPEMVKHASTDSASAQPLASTVAVSSQTVDASVAVASEEVAALKAEIAVLRSQILTRLDVKDELAEMSAKITKLSGENTLAIKTELQRSEKNARVFLESSLKRYDEIERLVTAEVRKVREVLRQGIQNDTSDLRIVTQKVNVIAYVLLSINALALIVFLMKLFLS